MGKKEALESSSLWGQRRSGTEKFGDKDVRGQRRQRRAGEPLGTKKFGDKGGRGELGEPPPGTKKFGDKGARGELGEHLGTKKSGDKGGRLSHPSNPAGTLAGTPAGSSLIKSLKV